MPKPPRLSRSAAKILDGRVDDIFDRLMVRLLGHAFTGRRLYVQGGTHEDFSLPGIFREAVTGEGGRPDFDILSGVAEIAKDYLSKHREEAKARTKHEVNALLQDLHAGKISREEFGNYTESALFKLWDSVRSNVERVVETSNENAKTSGIRDGLIQLNDKLGIEDPVVAWVIVHDDKVCDECRHIHTLPDGVTPRVWLSSEVETGYHKKGTQRPSWNLIHPHCRCALISVLPGFGFDSSGNVTWIGEGHSELEYQRSYKRPPKGEEPRLKRIGKSEGDIGEPIHPVKFGSMHLHMAHDKLHGPLQDWIHSPSEASKNVLLQTWTGLSEKEKAANAADVRDAFLRSHGKDSILAYRYKPRHDTGGMSLTSERPTYLSPDKYETYEVNAKDVIAHWGQPGLPLGGKAFGHEREMILAPGAQIRPLGKSGGAAQEALLEVLQKASKPVLEPLEKGLKQSQIQAALRAFGWQDKHGGGHDMMEHPAIGAKIPFQRGYSGDYDWNWVDKHLREAGLMRGRQNKVVADPKHAYYQHYVQSGHAQPTEPQKKTWEAPGATQHVPLESVELGGTPGGREHAEAVQALKAGRPQPAVEVMDLGNGTYGSLGNHHLVQAARDAGMTHIPVKIS